MRFRQRHVHRTIYFRLKDELTALGWMPAFGGPPINFGATPITLIDYEPIGAGKTPAPNTVAISIEDQSQDEAFELGGLEKVEYTLFIDIYPEANAIGVAIGDDIKDYLTRHSFPVKDFSQQNDPDSDEYLEFEGVLVENIPSAATTLDKRIWRSVKAMAVCYF